MPLSNSKLKPSQIPGLGEANIARLKSIRLAVDGSSTCCLDSPSKVVGLFCLFNRDKEQFSLFLQRTPSGNPMQERYANQVSSSFYEKTEQFCKPTPVVSDSVADHFQSRPLSSAKLGSSGGVVPGLATSVQVLEDRIRVILGNCGLTTPADEEQELDDGATPSTLQLFGLYLLLEDKAFLRFMLSVTANRDSAQQVCDALKWKASVVCGTDCPSPDPRSASRTKDKWSESIGVYLILMSVPILLVSGVVFVLMSWPE